MKAFDGYNSVMDNAGTHVATGGADRVTSYETMRRFYKSSWLAHEIAESIIIDGSRSLINLEETEDTDGLQVILTDHYMNAYKKARIYSRVYGWAIMVPVLEMIQDGAGYDQPLTAAKASPIKWWRVFTPLQVTPSTESNRNAYSEGYGLPSSFTIINSTGLSVLSAENVVIVADERNDDEVANSFIGRSFLEYCREPVERYEQAMTGIARLLRKAHVDVLKVEGLDSELSRMNCDTGGASVVEYYSTIARRMNQDGMMLIDAKNGELTSRNVQLGGYTQIISDMRKEVSGVANIPESMLFSEAYGGLINNGAGGDMERFLTEVDRDRESNGKVVVQDSFKLLKRLGYNVPAKTVIHSLVELDATKARLQMQADTTQEQQMFDNIIGGVTDE